MMYQALVFLCCISSALAFQPVITSSRLSRASKPVKTDEQTGVMEGAMEIFETGKKCMAIFKRATSNFERTMDELDIASSLADAERRANLLQGIIEDKIKTDPIIGEKVDDTLVYSDAVGALFNEYVGLVKGGILFVPEQFGMGKTCTISAIAQGRHTQGPDRFLSISARCGDSGDDLLNNIKKVLKTNTDPESLAKALVDSLSNNAITTDDKFKVNVTGVRPTLDYTKKGFPLLVIEELNAECLRGDAEDFTYGNNRDADAKTRSEFGIDMIMFLRALASHAYNQKVCVIITTKFPRVAKFLQTVVNGGEKCRIACSVLKVHDVNKYNALTFDFDEDFQGFGWTKEQVKTLMKTKHNVLIDSPLEKFIDDTVESCMDNDTFTLRQINEIIVRKQEERSSEEQRNSFVTLLVKGLVKALLTLPDEQQKK